MRKLEKSSAWQSRGSSIIWTPDEYNTKWMRTKNFFEAWRPEWDCPRHKSRSNRQRSERTEENTLAIHIHTYCKGKSTEGDGTEKGNVYSLSALESHSQVCILLLYWLTPTSYRSFTSYYWNASFSSTTPHHYASSSRLFSIFIPSSSRQLISSLQFRGIGELNSHSPSPNRNTG